MKPLLVKFSLLLTLIIPSTAYCEMYKWVDDEGNISYSDQPPFKGANTLTPPELSTLPTVNVPKQKATDEAATDNKQASYQLIKITSPLENETVRDNQGNITVTLGIEPALNIKQGHYISLLIDNKIAQDKLTGLSASFSNIDRGSHQITAIIKDRQGKILLSSSATTVHVRRQSILHPKPQ